MMPTPARAIGETERAMAMRFSIGCTLQLPVSLLGFYRPMAMDLTGAVPKDYIRLDV